MPFDATFFPLLTGLFFPLSLCRSVISRFWQKTRVRGKGKVCRRKGRASKTGVGQSGGKHKISVIFLWLSQMFFWIEWAARMQHTDLWYASWRDDWRVGLFFCIANIFKLKWTITFIIFQLEYLECFRCQMWFDWIPFQNVSSFRHLCFRAPTQQPVAIAIREPACSSLILFCY